MALERTFDVPIPVHDVQERWRQIQAQRRARVRFSPIDENHTNPGALGVAAGGAGGTFPGGTGGTPGPGGGKPGTTP